MLDNFWHKKEKPLQGLWGMGYVGSIGAHGGADSPTSYIEGTGGYVSAGVATDGYTYHTFMSPGTFTWTGGNSESNLEFLIVGGGGGGSEAGDAGGRRARTQRAGAGGVRRTGTTTARRRPRGSPSRGHSGVAGASPTSMQPGQPPFYWQMPAMQRQMDFNRNHPPPSSIFHLDMDLHGGIWILL